MLSDQKEGRGTRGKLRVSFQESVSDNPAKGSFFQQSIWGTSVEGSILADISFHFRCKFLNFPVPFCFLACKTRNKNVIYFSGLL